MFVLRIIIKVYLVACIVVGSQPCFAFSQDKPIIQRLLSKPDIVAGIFYGEKEYQYFERNIVTDELIRAFKLNEDGNIKGFRISGNSLFVLSQNELLGKVLLSKYNLQTREKMDSKIIIKNKYFEPLDISQIPSKSAINDLLILNHDKEHNRLEISKLNESKLSLITNLSTKAKKIVDIKWLINEQQAKLVIVFQLNQNIEFHVFDFLSMKWDAPISFLKHYDYIDAEFHVSQNEQQWFLYLAAQKKVERFALVYSYSFDKQQWQQEYSTEQKIIKIDSGQKYQQLKLIEYDAETTESFVINLLEKGKGIPERTSLGSRFKTIDSFVGDDSNTRDLWLEQMPDSTYRLHITNRSNIKDVVAIPLNKPSSLNILPDWFISNRVHAHTRLGFAASGYANWKSNTWLDMDESKQVAGELKEMGVTTMTRHAISRSETPWWNSITIPDKLLKRQKKQGTKKIAGIELSSSRNPVQEYISDANKEDIRVISYFWHQSDELMEELHPEWVCYDRTGKPARHRVRGTYLDITSGYREIVLARLFELAEMGTAGFYFDHRHLPSDGCWGTELEQEFWGQKKVTQQELMQRYPEWLDFMAEKTVDTMKYWVQQVRKQFPHITFLVSTSAVAGMTNREVITDLARVAIPKTEYDIATRRWQNRNVFHRNVNLLMPDNDIRMAMSWSLLRNVSDKPPHVWAPWFPDENHMMGFIGSVLTYGGIANLDVPEVNIIDSYNAQGMTSRQALIDGFALGAKVSSYFKNVESVKRVAVYFSEQARNQRGINYKKAWREVLWPITGFFGVCVRNQIPIDVIDDALLLERDLSVYEVLFVVNKQELGEYQQKVIKRFEQQGGVIIENNNGWLWHDKENNSLAVENATKVIRNSLATLPYRLKNAPPKSHAVMYQSNELASTKRILLAVSNAFDWVQTHTAVKPLLRSEINNPPVAIKNLKVEFNRVAETEWMWQKEKLSVYDAVSGKLLKFSMNDKQVIVNAEVFLNFMGVVVE